MLQMLMESVSCLSGSSGVEMGGGVSLSSRCEGCTVGSPGGSRMDGSQSDKGYPGSGGKGGGGWEDLLTSSDKGNSGSGGRGGREDGVVVGKIQASMQALMKLSVTLLIHGS